MTTEYRYKAKIVRIVDGDTLDAIVDLGFSVFIKERLRIANIDAPETYGVKKESLEYKEGMVAKERLIELTEGKDVIVKTQKKGKYGRYIAEIFLYDGRSVGEILLSEGLAKPYQ